MRREGARRGEERAAAAGEAGASAAAMRGGALLRLLVVLVVLFAGTALAWMLFLPAIVTKQLRQRTGFDAKVQSLAVNPFLGTVQIRGLVLTNPPTFDDSAFLELREFTANAEVFTLFSDRPVFTSMLFDAARLTVVKRDGGKTNATVFAGYLTPSDSGASRPVPREFLIRRLIVRIDEVVIVDQSTRVPTRQSYRLAMNQAYVNVTGVRQLFTPSTLKDLLPLGAALNGFLPGAIGQALGEVVRDAASASGKALREAGKTTGEKINGYFDALEESKKP